MIERRSRLRDGLRWSDFQRLGGCLSWVSGY
ncbi:MAG: hypothetical protein RLZZ245_3305 [Verrucomicrobiota bacterium]